MNSDADESRWPSIAFESREWEPSTVLPMSNRARARFAGPYPAAVVPHIAHRDIPIPSGLAAHAEEATTEIVRFDAEFGQRMVPFTSILLRSESAASSRIEQLTASARAIALAELGDTRSANASMIVSNIRAMDAAIQLADTLDTGSVIAMQHALLGDAHPEWTGRWREVQVWIGGGRFGPHGAAFIPPHADRVQADMDDLMAFARRVDLPALAHAAIAHAQFETIHPFPDGNGRTGRALVHAMLRRRGITRHVTVPISAGLLTDTVDYFAALDAYRNGHPEVIVEQMADAAFGALHNARVMIDELDDITSGWRTGITARADSAVWRLLDLLPRQPAVTVATAAHHLGVSATAAATAIDQLETAGVLVKAKGEERNRAWVAIEITAALDEFAARIGRRNRA